MAFVDFDAYGYTAKLAEKSFFEEIRRLKCIGSQTALKY
jgi:Holliday junction resolvasome RuvABC DNA-binding subunit